MKALILNSGMGSRMGVLTSEHPKCMTEISPRETILSRQLAQLCDAGVKQVVITTGLFGHVLEAYCGTAPASTSRWNTPLSTTRIIGSPIIFTAFTSPGSSWTTIFCSCTATWFLKTRCWTGSSPVKLPA